MTKTLVTSFLVAIVSTAFLAIQFGSNSNLADLLKTAQNATRVNASDDFIAGTTNNLSKQIAGCTLTDAEFLKYSNVYSDESEPSRTAERQQACKSRAIEIGETGYFIDALALPTTGSISKTKSLARQIYKTIMNDPHLGVSYAEVLYFYVKCLNQDDKAILKDFIAQTNQAFANGTGMDYWLTDTDWQHPKNLQPAGTKFISQEYYYRAYTVVKILKSMKLKKVQAKWTRVNYRHNLATEVNKARGVRANYQEDKKAVIWYCASSKTSIGGCLIDKRPEVYPEQKISRTVARSYASASSVYTVVINDNNNNDDNRHNNNDDSKGDKEKTHTDTDTNTDTTEIATDTSTDTEVQIDDQLVPDGEGAKNPDYDPMNQGNATDGDFINDDPTPGAVDYVDNEAEKNAPGAPDYGDGSYEAPYIDQGTANNYEPPTENIPIHEDSNGSAGDSNANTGITPDPD